MGLMRIDSRTKPQLDTDSIQNHSRSFKTFNKKPMFNQCRQFRVKVKILMGLKMDPTDEFSKTYNKPFRTTLKIGVLLNQK